MIYVGVDPSYSKTGVSYIDTTNKTIVFNAVIPGGTNKTYKDAIERAMKISIDIIQPTLISKKVTLVMEEPLINSQMASRLGLLSGVLITAFTLMPHIKEIYTLAPNVVSQTNRKVKGYTAKTRKKISGEQVEKYLEVFEQHGYTVLVYNKIKNKDGSMRNRKMSTDEAEGFILALLGMRDLNGLPIEIIEALEEINKGLTINYTLNPLKQVQEIEEST